MIWLIGMMGSGKSTVGRRLSEELDTSFMDSDAEVELASGMTVRELWERQGESALRDAETAVVRRLAAEADGIVATGGGVVLDHRNVEAMRSSGTVVWLRADAAVLADRITGTARPLLDGGDTFTLLRTILDARTELYEEAAHAIVDTDEMSVEQTVRSILRTAP